MELCRAGHEVTKEREAVIGGQWPVVASGQWSVVGGQCDLLAFDLVLDTALTTDHWSRPLFSSGMGLALGGEQVVGPFSLALACGCARAAGGCGGAIPILGRIGNSPHIGVVVKCYADQKVFSVGAEREAGCYAG
jgi:hypothetical protein